MSYSIQLPKYLLALFLTLPSLAATVHAQVDTKHCMAGDRYIVGLQERVNQVGNRQTQLNALIDSGSTLSSMDARNIELKTRKNGSIWVHFQIPEAADSNKMISIVRPLKRFAYIQTHHGSPQKRPVIETQIRIGPIETTTDFSLTSRSRFKNPILLGINTLKDIAVIDLAEEFLLSRRCSTLQEELASSYP
ncbi:ATP-dependent zinc protease family protein [Endozoicomonas ascidiicola]|uniref:ATP-dependent zinc protease family protein n=1 Tax=Endozoicomonas ascidiicola TaxID=1698521 RepID=UPI00082A00A6|nr:RimK/LysX family protein [Endozoicomonas ascidiicola]